MAKFFYADGRLKELLKAGGNGLPGSKRAIANKADPTIKGTWAHAKSQTKKDQKKYLKTAENS